MSVSLSSCTHLLDFAESSWVTVVRNEVAEIRESIDIARRTPMKGYMDFTKTPGNRRRLLIILTVAAGSQLNGVSIISCASSPPPPCI